MQNTRRRRRSAAQADFLTGLAQLHNFQYPEAARAFRRAELADPGFAMAYWGEAMTYNHPIWMQQDLTAARATLAKLAATPAARAANAGTPREQAYLHTIEILYGDGEKFDRDRRYAFAVEKLHATYPDDIDATCFYALALLGTSHAGRDVPTYMRAALAYSKIAPDSPHAQHMASHIFLALGMWNEVVESNEVAIRVGSEKVRARDKDAPLPACGHYFSWLTYGYLQQGRFADARHLIEGCGEEMHNRPRMATGADLLDSDETSAGAFSGMRTRYLVDTGDWAGPVEDMAVDVKGVIAAEYNRDFADVYRAARFGASDAIGEAADRLKATSTRLLAAITAAGRYADDPSHQILAIERDEIDGLVLFHRGDTAGAVATLSKAAAAEKVMPMEFGPPSVYKPANELLGELLLALGRMQEARAAFEAAQAIAPGRGQSLIGLAKCAQLLHEPELADSVEAQLAKVGLRAALTSPQPSSNW